MKDSVRIRKASKLDLAWIMRLAQVCLVDLVGSANRELFGIITKKIEWMLSKYPDTCFVAYTQSRLLGFSFTEYTDSDAFIVFLAVHPAHRRKGIGTMMIGKTLQQLKEKGIRWVGLMTPKPNKPARAFWMSQGFDDAKMKVFTKMLD